MEECRIVSRSISSSSSVVCILSRVSDNAAGQRRMLFKWSAIYTIASKHGFIAAEIRWHAGNWMQRLLHCDAAGVSIQRTSYEYYLCGQEVSHVCVLEAQVHASAWAWFHRTRTGDTQEAGRIPGHNSFYMAKADGRRRGGAGYRGEEVVRTTSWRPRRPGGGGGPPQAGRCRTATSCGPSAIVDHGFSASRFR